MSENKKEYRGSKSADLSKNIAVKEQRVDDSFCIKHKSMQIRCALMGFERNYQVNNLSKQLIKKFYSISNNQHILNPWFITGFTDAEGSFSTFIIPDLKLKIKWRILPRFAIKLHKKDIAILEAIKNTLGVGKIRKSGINSIQYVVEFW